MSLFLRMVVQGACFNHASLFILLVAFSSSRLANEGFLMLLRPRLPVTWVVGLRTRSVELKLHVDHLWYVVNILILGGDLWGRVHSWLITCHLCVTGTIPPSWQVTLSSY